MLEQLPLALGGRHGFLLEDFKGERNQALLSMLKDASCEKIGKGLFLWGESGVGLSHLLQSFCYHLLMQGKKVFFWCEGMPIPDFDHLSGCWDAYVFDDLAAILGDKSSEICLYNAYNVMKEGSLLIVGGHQPCDTIQCALPDLHSRLQSLISQRVFPLSEDELALLIKKRASDLGHQLSDKIIAHMLRHFDRSTKHQLRLLDQLDHQSWIDKKPINLSSFKALMDKRIFFR